MSEAAFCTSAHRSVDFICSSTGRGFTTVISLWPACRAHVFNEGCEGSREARKAGSFIGCLQALSTCTTLENDGIEFASHHEIAALYRAMALCFWFASQGDLES